MTCPTCRRQFTPEARGQVYCDPACRRPGTVPIRVPADMATTIKRRIARKRAVRRPRIAPYVPGDTELARMQETIKKATLWLKGKIDDAGQKD